MAKGLDKVLASVTKTEQVVTCAICGKKHSLDSKEFVVFYGDVMVGLDSPAVSGNIDDKGKIIGSSVLCLEHEAVDAFVSEMKKLAHKNSVVQRSAKKEVQDGDEDR
jgi:hypothetical protein